MKEGAGGVLWEEGFPYGLDLFLEEISIGTWEGGRGRGNKKESRLIFRKLEPNY